MKQTIAIALTALANVVFSANVVFAEEVKILEEFKGSVGNLALQKKGPKGPFVADKKTLTAMWEAWKVEGKLDSIDLKKHLVLVATTRGSRLSLSPTRENDAVKVLALATRDLRPGFRYHIVVVSREGVKSVNGKPLK